MTDGRFFSCAAASFLDKMLAAPPQGEASNNVLLLDDGSRPTTTKVVANFCQMSSFSANNGNFSRRQPETDENGASKLGEAVCCDSNSTS